MYARLRLPLTNTDYQTRLSHLATSHNLRTTREFLASHNSVCNSSDMSPARIPWLLRFCLSLAIMRSSWWGGLAQVAPAFTSATAAYDLDRDRDLTVPLEGSWRRQIGDDPAWADPNFNDSKWPLVSPLRPWSEQKFSGVAWVPRQGPRSHKFRAAFSLRQPNLYQLSNLRQRSALHQLRGYAASPLRPHEPAPHVPLSRLRITASPIPLPSPSACGIGPCGRTTSAEDLSKSSHR
jgi:hypothetical protein